MNTFDIAIVGPRDAVIGFKALGLRALDVTYSNKAVQALYDLKAELVKGEDGEERPKYAIIFIIESLARAIPENDYQKLAAAALPAIIALPGPSGTTGFGITRLGQIVEKAIGSNILKAT